VASQAEVDLIISTANALPQLERDLERIVRTAEADADSVELQALLDADDSLAALIRDLDSVIADAELAADPVQLEARLDQLASLTELQDDLSDVIHDVELRADEIRLDAELDADLARLDADMAQLVRELEASAPEVDIEVDVDREGRGSRAINALGRAFTGALPAIGKGAGAIGAAGLAAGAAVPLLAGLAAAVEAVAPASAVAVSGLLAVQLAAGTVKLAMIGVEDAITAAFDPEANPEDLAKAMERLAPNARTFVVQLQAMRKDLSAIQQDVQQNFFAGFDNALRNLGATVLPVVGNALRNTSKELNLMALGAADAAVKLAQDGILGKALDGAVKGIGNLRQAPGQAVTALGQLGAAAAPAFERITQAAAKSATGISERLSKAFESGALEEAISTAVDSIAQLGRVAGNVFGGLGNILRTVTGNGEGLFSVMEKVTAAFESVTASNGFQQALKALVQTAGVVADTVLPLISQALQALGPIFQALAAPVQILVRALGDGLSKIMTALAPVLVSVGHAFGQLVIAVTPLINLAATLIAAILPVLTPLFEALGQVINAVVPFIEAIASVLQTALVPIFETLAKEVLPAILPPFVDLATKIFPILTEIITQLAPVIAVLAEAFGQVLVALAPVIAQLLTLISQIQDELMPILQPVIDFLIKFAISGLQFTADVISGILVPALGILVDLLKGDFSAAWESAKELVRKMAQKSLEFIQGFVDGSSNSINKLAGIIAEKFLQMARDMGERIRTGIEGVLRDFASLPGRIAASLGDTGQTLVRAGQDFVLGFVRGIEGQIRSAAEAAARMAQSAVNAAKDFLGIQSPSRLMMAVGGDTIEGFRLGIAGGIPDLRSELQGIAALAPSFALPGGQTLQLPQAGDMRPTVQVFLGNERLDGHFDARIAQSNATRDRLAITGVRR
jgi:phage-related protein